MKLSIIIPYYKTYELTKKLLEVLQKQYDACVEIILIDDGCNETRLDEFKFVKITHLNKNYGASHAWNVGLKQATGEYIGFIDSDDMVTHNYIATLLYAIEKENTDEIIFDFWLNPDNTYNTRRVRHPKCRAIWKAIYKRWLVPEFDETAKCKTDVPFKEHLKNTEHTVSYINIPLYYYFVGRQNSLTWKFRHNVYTLEDCGKAFKKE